MDLIGILTITLSILYILYIVFERLFLVFLRKHFKYVIHINGIRGKSTTTRLIDAGLRNSGFRVFSKTTGTIPYYIDSSNNEHKIKRLGKANIREQIKMMYKAYKDKADCLVLECMAVNPELQKISEEKILKADITIITNVREDHIGEMGKNLNEIAEAFSETIPSSGSLIIQNSPYDNLFMKKARERNTKVFIAHEYDGDDLMDTFKENIELALEVSNILNLDKDKFLEGMKMYHHDVGALKEIKKDDTLFINGLSINDPESILKTYENLSSKYDKSNITILLNSRSDRPTRAIQHINMFKNISCKKVIIYGSNIDYIYKRIARINPNLQIEKFESFEKLEEENIIFAIGNIGEKGMKLINYFAPME